jgi:hypothetical protein
MGRREKAERSAGYLPGLLTAIRALLPPLDQLESELAEAAAPAYGQQAGRSR